ncbi:MULTISPECIES: peptidoglycan DD-metalloendopeptidase family protein [Flavobacterium]|uniref:murein hydrolase activator EnvC family protein n=1 Tax=Flavobacterium TaxID=237 RepID=UPI00086CC979|nr:MULTISPECIES: peptidoglycan DD-metalloendopeptidase family protein [Flavobacterium]MBN9283300.1 peptidoglycan DD-metalloendopeptidase family protein [Flavobacterium sp.]ODS80228.1 MAG: peptidase M23 [Chryseobacterium sp. SCN 40-13]OJV68031.1 MAG: peptidase M23 [Flavobacterium sp. 40-81]
MYKKLFSLFFIFLSIASWSQTEDKQRQLEERKAQIQKEIREVQQLLQSEKKKEKSVLVQISQQTTKIKLSEKLINTTQKQTRLLTDDIYLKQLEINKLGRELTVLKEDYAKMIVKSYKSRSEQSRIMFVLSSENFLQAYKRVQYMKQYASFRKMQGVEIKNKSLQLQDATTVLESKKKVKQKLLVESEKEKKALEEDKSEQEKLMKVIQKDKKKLAGDIKKKQEESRAIDRQIQRLIREAIAEANRKAREAAAALAARNKAAGKKVEKAEPATTAAAESTTKFYLTPEGKALADNFRANKGRLPWPVEKGFVSLGFGDQPHPIHKSLIVHNSGVEISTEPGTNARAVFGGEVLQVQVISANNRAVFIQHGDYVTVYLNLSKVFVGKGDKVSIKQSIGEIHTNSSGRAVLKFLISQNTTTLNPQSWLANM